MDKKGSATPVSAIKSATDGKSGSGTAKGKGKGKKAKAKEEEERRRLEEEERLRQEQEEKERKEREQREKEEEEKRKKKIFELKKLELTEFYDILRNINEKVTNHHKNERAQAEWNRYIKCDGIPNPTIAAEINTFMTLWKEDKENNDIENSFRFTELSQKLVDELRTIINQISDDPNATKKVTEYNQIIADLENCLWMKLNEASHKLLREASNHVDPESLNYDYSEGNSSLYYCFWANLSHNPRIKDFSFVKKHFSFNLPRPLTLAHVAVRSLFMNFDIYSSRSRTYKCPIKNEVFEFDPIPEIKVEEVKVEEPSKELTEDDLLPPELRALMEKSDLDKETDVTQMEKEKTLVKPEPVPEQENTKKQIDPEEYARLQELSDSYVVDLRNFMPIGPIIHFGLYHIPPQPKKVKQWTITQNDHVDVLTPYHYPTQEPSVVEYAWQEFLRIKEGGAPHQEDPADTIKSKKSELNATLKSDAPEDETAGSDKNKKGEMMIKALKNEGPVEVHYKLPKDVYYGEAPQLARWDAKKKHWRTDEILNFSYTEETGEVSFKTYHFSPYCLLQDRHVHMPIQSWRITPREATNTCMFFIESSSFEMNIEIRNDEVRLCLPPRKVIEEDPKDKKRTPLGHHQKKSETPKEEPETENEKNYRRVVESFANKWFSLDTLIKILRSVGLNVFPEPDSDKFVTITNKNKKLEWCVYQNIALCSNLMAFAYSRWNMEINDENKIVLLGLLHYTNTPPNLDNYQCISCTNDIYKTIDTNESSDEFNDTCMSGTEEHASLFNLCCELVQNKEPLVNRMTQINPLYFETCAKLLEATKIITFS